MAKLSLRQATVQFAVSRQTLGKALTNGTVSGTRDDAGNWQIDSAELMRVYQPRETAPPTAPPRTPAFTTPAMPKTALGRRDDSAVTIARLQAELSAERELRAADVAAERAKVEILERYLADVRLRLPPPDTPPPRRRWWPF